MTGIKKGVSTIYRTKQPPFILPSRTWPPNTMENQYPNGIYGICAHGGISMRVAKPKKKTKTNKQNRFSGAAVKSQVPPQTEQQNTGGGALRFDGSLCWCALAGFTSPARKDGASKPHKSCASLTRQLLFGEECGNSTNGAAAQRNLGGKNNPSDPASSNAPTTHSQVPGNVGMHAHIFSDFCRQLHRCATWCFQTLYPLKNAGYLYKKQANQ